jgi:biotin carboxylase
VKVLVATVCTPDDRQALAIIRALASAGVRPYAGGTRYFGQAFHSRRAAGRIRYPHPAENEGDFLATLAAECSRLGIEVVLPASDYVVETLNRRRDDLAGNISCIIPPAGSLPVVRDKLRTWQLARNLGLDVPATLCPAGMEELRRAADTVQYLVVVKPRKSLGAIGMWLARSREELLEGCAYSPDFSDDVFEFKRPLVQEYVPGEVHDACVLFREGDLVVGLTQRRIMMYPPGGAPGY